MIIFFRSIGVIQCPVGHQTVGHAASGSFQPIFTPSCMLLFLLPFSTMPLSHYFWTIQVKISFDPFMYKTEKIKNLKFQVFMSKGQNSFCLLSFWGFLWLLFLLLLPLPIFQLSEKPFQCLWLISANIVISTFLPLSLPRTLSQMLWDWRQQLHIDLFTN